MQQKSIPGIEVYLTCERGNGKQAGASNQHERCYGLVKETRVTVCSLFQNDDIPPCPLGSGYLLNYDQVLFASEVDTSMHLYQTFMYITLVYWIGKNQTMLVMDWFLSHYTFYT